MIGCHSAEMINQWQKGSYHPTPLVAVCSASESPPFPSSKGRGLLLENLLGLAPSFSVRCSPELCGPGASSESSLFLQTTKSWFYFHYNLLQMQEQHEKAVNPKGKISS